MWIDFTYLFIYAIAFDVKITFYSMGRVGRKSQERPRGRPGILDPHLFYPTRRLEQPTLSVSTLILPPHTH